jgi:hypothetical protein
LCLSTWTTQTWKQKCSKWNNAPLCAPENDEGSTWQYIQNCDDTTINMVLVPDIDLVSPTSHDMGTVSTILICYCHKHIVFFLTFLYSTCALLIFVCFYSSLIARSRHSVCVVTCLFWKLDRHKFNAFSA